MNLKRAFAVLAILCVSITAALAWQQQRASPHETVEATIGGKKSPLLTGVLI